MKNIIIFDLLLLCLCLFFSIYLLKNSFDEEVNKTIEWHGSNPFPFFCDNATLLSGIIGIQFAALAFVFMRILQKELCSISWEECIGAGPAFLYIIMLLCGHLGFLMLDEGGTALFNIFYFLLIAIFIASVVFLACNLFMKALVFQDFTHYSFRKSLGIISGTASFISFIHFYVLVKYAPGL